MSDEDIEKGIKEFNEKSRALMKPMHIVFVMPKDMFIPFLMGKYPDYPVEGLLGRYVVSEYVEAISIEQK